MKVYYTGAQKFEAIQSNPGLSLGGYISGSEVPNASLNNLFSEISQYTIQSNKKEIRGIVLYNDTLTTLTGLKAYFLGSTDDSDSDGLNDTYGSFKIGVAAVAADDCGDLLIEALQNMYSSPYNTTLVQATAGSPLVLPDLPSKTYIGLFIQRSLADVAKAPLSDADLLAVTDGYVLPTEENIELKIDWN